MARALDIYEEVESEPTRFGRPSGAAPTHSGSTPSVPPHSGPSYDDEELFERERTPKTSFAAHSPFVAPAEIEGDRSPAIRARRASYVDRAELGDALQIARAQQAFVETHDDLVSSAPEIEEVTKFAPLSHRPRAQTNPARPITRRASNPDDQPLDYDALKLFLFEDGPDPGASDYVPAPPSRASRASRAEMPPPPSVRTSVRPPMTSAHPEFEGPRVGVRRQMFSSHPDFEGPRGGEGARNLRVPPVPPVPPAPSARMPMLSSHPDFEGPRGGNMRQQMFSSHPDFEGPRGGNMRAPFSSRGRMPPASLVEMAAEMVETADRIVPSPAPGARAPMPAMHPHTFSGGAFAGNTMGIGMAMPVREESSPSHDGHASWVVPTPPLTARTNRPLDTGSKFSLSFAVAAFTAIAALLVMIGALLFTRGDARPAAARAAEGTVAETFPPPPVVPTAPIANANARADQTGQLPPSGSAMAPPPPADGPDSAKAVAKKKAKKRPAAKPVVEEEEEAEEASAPKTTKKGAKAADKNVEKLLAELQEEQLRR